MNFESTVIIPLMDYILKPQSQALTLSTLGNNISRLLIEIFFLFFQENTF